MFRTRETRLGLAVLYTPGNGGVHTTVNAPRSPPAASQRQSPWTARLTFQSGQLCWRGIIEDSRL